MKKEYFTVHAERGDTDVKHGILFEFTDEGEINVYQNTPKPYTALRNVREIAEDLMNRMQDTMERKMEEANRVLSDDLK